MTSTRAASSAARASSSRRDDWRRAAHKCSGLAYTGDRPARRACSTPASPMSPKRAGDARVKRIAVMDSDGFNHRYVTAGRHDRPDPAAVAQGATGSLMSASPAAARRSASSTSDTGAAAAAGRRRRDELRAALLAGRRRIALFDDARRQQRHLCGRRERRLAAAADHRAGHRHRRRASRPTAARSCSKATVPARSSSM